MLLNFRPTVDELTTDSRLTIGRQAIWGAISKYYLWICLNDIQADEVKARKNLDGLGRICRTFWSIKTLKSQLKTGLILSQKS